MRETQTTTKTAPSKKKPGKTTITSLTYKTTSTLTRAICKAESSLPNSPRKHSLVIHKLCEETCCRTSGIPAKTLGRPSLSQGIVTMVANFYEQDDISRTAQGKHDTIVVCTDVRNETRQIRHLIMTVAEAYKLFRDEVDECRSTQMNALESQSLLNYNLSMYVCLVIYQSMFVLADTIKI